MKIYEGLEKALAVIENEKNWTKGDYQVGNAYCAEGACLVSVGLQPESPRAWRVEQADQFVTLINALIRALGGGRVHRFNDTHTHAEVVALFQKAIRDEKLKEGVEIEIPVEPVKIAA